MRADVSCCFEVGIQNRNRAEMNDRMGPDLENCGHGCAAAIGILRGFGLSYDLATNQER